MHICLLVNADLASNYALNILLPELAKQHKLWLFCSSQVGGDNNKPAALQQLQFFEQALFNQLLFIALEKATPKEGALKSFAHLTPYLQAPCAELNQINSAASYEMLAALELDLILSVRYGRILQAPVIQLPRYGVLNLHSGLLPQYRGVMATFYAMLNAEQQIGTSLHYIRDASIDTGEVISLNPITTDYNQCYLANVLSLYPTGCQAVLEAVSQLDQGKALSAVHQVGDGCYYSFPDCHLLQQFSQAGHKLVSESFVLDFARQYLLP